MITVYYYTDEEMEKRKNMPYPENYVEFFIAPGQKLRLSELTRILSIKTQYGILNNCEIYTKAQLDEVRQGFQEENE